MGLLRLLPRFLESVEEAAKTLSPHVICTYIFQLAQTFNVFYEKCPILKEENKEVRELRLALCAATADTIKQGLYLLGIKVLNKI